MRASLTCASLSMGLRLCVIKMSSDSGPFLRLRNLRFLSASLDASKPSWPRWGYHQASQSSLLVGFNVWQMERPLARRRSRQLHLGYNLIRSYYSGRTWLIAQKLSNFNHPTLISFDPPFLIRQLYEEKMKRCPPAFISGSPPKLSSMVIGCTIQE